MRPSLHATGHRAHVDVLSGKRSMMLACRARPRHLGELGEASTRGEARHQTRERKGGEEASPDKYEEGRAGTPVVGEGGGIRRGGD